MMEKQYITQSNWGSVRKEILDELGEDKSAEALLDNLLRDTNGWNNSDYRVIKYTNVQKRSIGNRLNYLWVWPIFICTIPFSWVLTGTYGLDRNSKVGKVVDWLVKFDS
jgi:hypothetical protein